MRNEWVQIDPRFWDTSMDANINIALGNGDTNEKLQALMMIMAKQEQILQQLGPTNPLVTPQQFSNTLRKIVELSGFKDSTSFFQDIPADYVPPPPQQKPSPEEVLAQVQAESIKADIQKKAAELELKSTNHRSVQPKLMRPRILIVKQCVCRRSWPSSRRHSLCPSRSHQRLR